MGYDRGTREALPVIYVSLITSWNRAMAEHFTFFLDRKRFEVEKLGKDHKLPLTVSAPDLQG